MVLQMALMGSSMVPWTVWGEPSLAALHGSGGPPIGGTIHSITEPYEDFEMKKYLHGSKDCWYRTMNSRKSPHFHFVHTWKKL